MNDNPTLRTAISALELGITDPQSVIETLHFAFRQEQARLLLTQEKTSSRQQRLKALSPAELVRHYARVNALLPTSVMDKLILHYWVEDMTLNQILAMMPEIVREGIQSRAES